MKILHVNKFFDLHGGAEVYMHRLMAHQRQAGHEVHAFSTRSIGNVATPDAGYFVARADYTKSEGASADLNKAAAFIWNREAEQAMRKALAEIKPDRVHVHNIYHHLSASILTPIRKSGIPCVQTLHDYKLACPNYKMFTEGLPCERCQGGKYYEAIKHKCLGDGFAGNALAAIEMGLTKGLQSYERTMRIFICPSQFMADKMAKWGEPASKLRVVVNPAEENELDAQGDGGYVLAVGRLSPEKGFDQLVRAAAALPGIQVRIAGTGPQEAGLKQLAARSKLNNVTFLGYADKVALQAQRRHARALIVPSVWYENAPLAVLESMAQGLPVIASRIGGLPELVQDGVNGSLVEAGDAGLLATAILRLCGLSSAEWSLQSQAAHRAMLERHAWSSHLKALDAIYQEVS